MAVAYLHEFPGGTHEQAQQIDDSLGQQGDMPPAGALFHSEGPMDGGWWVFDVRESGQSARAFYDGRMRAILSQMAAPAPSVRRLDVHWHSAEAPGTAG